MKTIVLAEYGILPGTDCAEEVNRIFSENREDCTFVFEPGDYRIRTNIRRPLALSNTDVIPARSLGILLENMKNVRLCGRGARLLLAAFVPLAVLANLRLLLRVWRDDLGQNFSLLTNLQFQALPPAGTGAVNLRFALFLLLAAWAAWVVT